ncbi:MAG: CopG family transcriptional regulator [Desulfobacteraceae bacterium]|nr:CopG family transcriptional regulator [Desulfobacteraceae bacterium]
MSKTKQEIITFKADGALLKAMKGIPNRSEFIRNAILASLNNICPICKGTGILPPHQKAHMDEFLTDHSLEECEKCNEMHLVCPYLRKTAMDKGVKG